ncbi:MAG: hypothetical protein ACRC14_03075 [Paracoccaceae bacterium]
MADDFAADTTGRMTVANSKDKDMRISYFCFILSALAGIVGMVFGLYMGIVGDHSLSPSHAHLNLAGWVTMMLYGLYYRGAPQGDTGLRWVQAGLGGAGFPAFAGGLGFYLQTGSETAFVVLSAGTVGVIAAMALFVVILLRDARLQERPQTRWGANPVGTV